MLTARQTLPNQFAFESNALLDCKAIKVFAKACLPALKGLSGLFKEACQGDQSKIIQVLEEQQIFRLSASV
jgi:hypothetical protein